LTGPARTRRLFVAAWLPPEAADEAAEVVERLRAGGAEARWVPPGNLHVTLRFLGDVDGETAAAVADALPEVVRGFAPFPLRLAGLGTFPPRGEPRVAWIGVDAGAEELGRLAVRTERALLQAGVLSSPEPRPFRAHVTIGRPLRPGGLGRWQGLLGDTAFRGGTHVLREVRLVESRLSPRGAEYAPVARFPLDGERPAGATFKGGSSR
jgi:2'-5' RNA ligase